MLQYLTIIRCIFKTLVDYYFTFFFLYFCIFVFLPFLGPLPVAYGGSQAMGLIGAIAAGLSQRHSNVGYKPSL